MLTTYILIGFFLASLLVVVSMVAYKMFKMDKDTYIVPEHDVRRIVSLHTKDVFKKTSKESVKISLFFLGMAVTKARPFIKKIKKMFMDQYNDFFDSVNGKEEVKEKGAASFFLKTVAQHKKEIKDKK